MNTQIKIVMRARCALHFYYKPTEPTTCGLSNFKPTITLSPCQLLYGHLTVEPVWPWDQTQAVASVSLEKNFRFGSVQLQLYRKTWKLSQFAAQPAAQPGAQPAAQPGAQPAAERQPEGQPSQNLPAEPERQPSQNLPAEPERQPVLTPLQNLRRSVNLPLYNTKRIDFCGNKEYVCASATICNFEKSYWVSVPVQSVTPHELKVQSQIVKKDDFLLGIGLCVLLFLVNLWYGWNSKPR